MSERGEFPSSGDRTAGPAGTGDATSPVLRLRKPAHRGSVLAAGLVFEAADATGDETETRRRILALSPHLTEVIRVAAPRPLLVALLHQPVRLLCDAAPGAPLVREGRFLSTAPLAPDELAALDAAAPPLGTVLLFTVAGEVHAIALAEHPREDLAAWLDVTALAPRFDLRSLGEPAAAPRAVLAEIELHTRAALGVAPLAEESRGLVATLLGRRAERDERDDGDGASSTASSSADSPARRLLTGLRAPFAAVGHLFSRLRGAFSRPGRRPALGDGAPVSSGSRTAGRGARNTALALGAPHRTLLRRALDALRELPARAVMATRLRRIIGRRYARYLQRVFDMFDGNRLEEALRHAIPLGGDLGEALRQLSLNPPPPRDSLSVSPERTAVGTSMAFGSDIYAALKARYRRAFERLRDQGDFEKAAFVLAELLHADEEAVSFLEKHDKLRLAAELAEARNLPPGLVIRQWFLAGEPARAIRLARKSGAFADAVVRLGATHPEHARTLRLLWAEALAAAGAYPAAVDVVWPLSDDRPLTYPWIDRAIEIGGVAGAAMLVRKARSVPDGFPPVRERVLALLADDALAWPVLETLAIQLCDGEPTPELRVLIRAVARRLLAEPESVAATRLIPRLLDASGDPALRIDATPVVSSLHDAIRKAEHAAPAPLPVRSPPLELRWFANERGALPILDACELPDGKLLLALGELGAWLITRDGRVAARFSEPAEKLVLSDHGDRVILIARRGDVHRLSRLDLITRRASHWCDVELDELCDSYDGATWFVSRGGAVYAIETDAAGWQHAWHVEERGAQVFSLARDAASLSILFIDQSPEHRVEVWRYELPKLVLRQRTPFALEEGETPRDLAVSPGGALAGWCSRLHRRRTPVAFTAGKRRRLRWNALGLPPLAFKNIDEELYGSLAPDPEESSQWWVSARPACNEELAALIVSRGDDGMRMAVFDLATGELRLHLRADGVLRSFGVRMQPDRLLAFDDHGRIAVYELTSGRVLHLWRLGADRAADY